MKRNVVVAAVAALIGATLVVMAPVPARADSLAVRGSACGYITNVGLFGGPQAKLGCEPQAGQPFAPANDASRSPSVALPGDGQGSETPITAYDGDGAAGRYGPAVIFGGRWPEDVAQAQPSGPISVSTQGTPATGVTSATDITLHDTPKKVACYERPGELCDAPGGFGPFPVEGDAMHVECSAGESGVSGSTTLANSVLATETDADGNPTVWEAVPDNPPPNYTREGVITNVGDVFSVVYNQQFISSDGTLTVIGAHMYLYGPTAVGEVIKGMVTCGVTPAPAQPVDNVPPTCSTAIVEQVAPTDPTPKTPRSELVGAFDAGGIRSVENIEATNATASPGQASQHEYLRFTPGQTGPLQLFAVRTQEAEQRNLGIYWSLDVVDMAGNRTHCTGVKLGPPVVVDDSYQTSQGAQLVVPAPGVLANDTPGPDNDPLSAALLTEPANGTVQVNPDGSFAYSPDPVFSGVDSFEYRADDGTGGLAGTVTVAVTPLNAAPVAVPDAYTATAGTPLTVAAPGVLGNDVDAEGDPLTAALASAPAHGTVALSPDGSFVYTPDASHTGPDTFTYDVSDGHGGSATGTVAIAVAPSVGDDPLPDPLPVPAPDPAKACRDAAKATGRLVIGPSDCNRRL